MERNERLAVVQRMIPADLELYYPDGDQEAFWRGVRESEDYAEELAEIRAEGERLLPATIPPLTYSLFAIFGKRGSRLEYERVYFERRRRLNTFALLAMLEPEDEEAEAALHEILWSVCDEYTWCLPAHLDAGEPESHSQAIDLFAAETGFALSEIGLLLGDRLPAMLRHRIGTEVDRRLFKPFLEGGPYFWEAAEHNWSAVCSGSIGAAALIQLRDEEKLTDVIGRVQASLACYLRGFGEDGGCIEGLGYWNYGFGYFTYFADLLDRRTRGELDWFAEDRVRRIAEFQQKSYLGGDLAASFSDTVPRSRVHLGLSHYLARRYANVEAPPTSLRADYRADHCSRWAPAFRNLIWRSESWAERREPVREWRAAGYYLPDAQWLISRHRSRAVMFGFAAKGGHNAEPHNHNDLGQFIVAAGGEAFVADLGSGEYTADYFGAGRYGYDCNGSQGHAVPIVNGRHQAAGEEHRAVVLEAVTGEARDALRLDLTRAYDRRAGLETFTRSLDWSITELPSLELTDVFRFAEPPESLTERIITLIPPQLGPHGEIWLNGQGGGAGCRLRVAYDALKLEPAVQPRMFTNHYGVPERWYALDFLVKRPERSERVRLKFEFV
ncbi:hypothetical protein [Paenibacillus macerans]|uniref:hypothetical protein n=1 Tax=Paenibacillus macerans TaxID=44252 RepID=UPI003D31634F